MGIPTCEFFTRKAEHEAVVRIVGELDLATAPRLREALLDLSRHGARQVTVDLAEMDFIDSTGLGVLVAALKCMRENGGDLELHSPTAATMKVFEIAGFTRVFTINGAPVDAANGQGGRSGAEFSA